MPTPIELALSNLLPTVSFLDPELLALANSLLSQSRAKASNLKQEEEIGRIYACAHIACQRLANRLELEIDKPKPPCKPKVYQKLLKYLESVLGTVRTPTASTRTPTTGGRKRDVYNESTPSKNAQNGTPSKRAKVTPATRPEVVRKRKRADEDEMETEQEDVATPRQQGAKKSKHAKDQEEEEIPGLPPYTMSLTRAICKATSTSKAAPHVLVGIRAAKAEIESRDEPPIQVESATKSRGRRKRTPQSQTKSASKSSYHRLAPSVELHTTEVVSIKYSALILALHTITCARLRGLDVSDSSVHRLKKVGMKAIQAFAQEHENEKGYEEIFAEEAGDSAQALQFAHKKFEDDTAFYILEAFDNGWLEMEWYKNIPENIDWEDGVNDDDDEQEGESESDQEIDESEDDDEEETTMTLRRKKGKLSKTPLRRKEKRGGKVALNLDEDGDEIPAAGLLPGLGTMFQPVIDWLSDQNREDYRAWKKGVVKRMEQMESWIHHQVG